MDPPASPHESLNAGNYNDGNSYTVLEQVAFARFVVDSLTANSIPFVVNEGGEFYDYQATRWLDSMLPVVDGLVCTR